MKEKDIETRIVNHVQELGGIAYKFVSPERRSVPDRLIVLPGRSPFWIEVKTKTGVLSSGQKREIKRLRDLQQTVYVVYSVEQGIAVVDIER